MIRHHEYGVLDGLRGTAALCVMLFHYHQAYPTLLHNAYLAVDLFFLLSGFVIAYAYEDRLKKGLSAIAFMRIRTIRLWPLFVLGCLLGAAPYFTRAGSLSLSNIAFTVLPNVLFLPSAATSEYLFPINIPAWSLLFEIIANLAYAALAPSLTSSRLVGLIALLGGAVILTDLQHGNLGGGDTWRTFADGLIRVGFSFSSGVLLYRWRRKKLRLPIGAQAGISVLLLAVLVIAFHSQPAQEMRWLYDLAFVLAVSPMAVATGSILVVPDRLLSIYTKVGFVSYSIYILHEPLASYVTGMSRAFGIISDVADPALLALKITLVLPAASAAAYLYDEPFRRWLSSRWRDKSAAIEGSRERSMQ